MASVTLKDVTKVYPNGFTAVTGLDLHIADGEFLVLVGPSGCGKSTALRMIAGLEEVSAGELCIGDRVVNDLPPKERDIAMVFQNYALYPHMTVAQNIGFALKLAKVPRDEVRRRVREAARTLQLEAWLDRKPGQLSGGQRQRVAMGRAIVREPSVFLMDEPLSNLDAKLRVQVRAEISKLQRDLGTTTAYVTHDQVEAMTMGDRVAVLNAGRLLQVAPPDVLYDEPADVFVAAFIGSPSMNLLEGRIEMGEDGGATVSLGGQSLAVPPSLLAERPALRAYDGGEVVVGIRPEQMWDARASRRRGPRMAGHAGPSGPGPSGSSGLPGRVPGTTLEGVVELREALGAELLVHLRTDARPAVTDETRRAAETVDTAAVTELEHRARQGEALVVARLDGNRSARVGDTVAVAVAVDELHFFDPATGRRIVEGPPARPAAAVAADPLIGPLDDLLPGEEQNDEDDDDGDDRDEDVTEAAEAFVESLATAAAITEGATSTSGPAQGVASDGRPATGTPAAAESADGESADGEPAGGEPAAGPASGPAGDSGDGPASADGPSSGGESAGADAPGPASADGPAAGGEAGDG